MLRLCGLLMVGQIGINKFWKMKNDVFASFAVEDELKQLLHLRCEPNSHASIFVFDDGAADEGGVVPGEFDGFGFSQAFGF